MNRTARKSNTDQIRLATLYALIAGLGVGVLAVQEANAGEDDKPPLKLSGVVRDFKPDHPDFQRKPKNESGSGQFGHYIEIVGDELGSTGKPVYRSGGRRVSRQWTDANGYNITPRFSGKSYIESVEGDSLGSAGGVGSAVTDAESFSDWFRDVPGVNQSVALQLEFEFDNLTQTYVFDDRSDPVFQDLGGFFPINGQLYGDYQDNTNFHFTFELDTEFIYDAEADMSFTFNGDDDVWVFIDGKLVIDLGGVHGQIEQTIDLDRLGFLEDGQSYQLKFFFAERHTTQSNFRIETNIPLRAVEPPSTTALHD